MSRQRLILLILAALVAVLIILTIRSMPGTNSRRIEPGSAGPMASAPAAVALAQT